MQTANAEFGTALRWWRNTRRFTQLQLSNEAEVSSRHISFLETGKAKPSREMVVHLGIVLDLSLRDRNSLLHSAGFAPVYPQADLDDPEMNEVRGVLQALLHANMPNPAILVDRRGDVADLNAAALSLIGATVAPDSSALSPVSNVHRLTFHPDGIRKRTENWAEVATTVLQRLEREQAFRPADKAVSDILDEMLAYPGVEALRKNAGLPTGADLLLPVHVRTFDGKRLSLVTTIATIGAPYDVTLEELRLETFFPTDDITTSTLVEWGLG